MRVVTKPKQAALASPLVPKGTAPSPGVSLHRREQPQPGPFSQESTGERDPLQGLLPLPCLGAYGDIGMGGESSFCL